MKILGIFHSAYDPSAALIIDGKVIAYCEEERILRNKHAYGWFPTKSIKFVLQEGNLKMSDIDYIAQAWDVTKYDNGSIQRVYDEINSKYPTTEADIAYQRRHISALGSKSQKKRILQNLRKHFGDIKLPEIRFVNHHLAHAVTSYFNSGINESLVLTVDGSGEDVTSTWWLGKDNNLTLLHEIKIPHSLGWLYSAFTEYLGFEAYDGEYKVMGLAAYGQPNDEIRKKIDKMIWYDGKGGFESDPMILARGERSYSYYFPDALPELMGRLPRTETDEIDQWHMDCAYEVQQKLEDIVQKMTAYWVEKTGVKKLCISGGVGLNVKMNGNLFDSGIVEDVFVYPICSDAGSSIGAALTLQYEFSGLKNTKLDNLYLGHQYTDEQVQTVLNKCNLKYRIDNNIEKTVAELLSQGKIIGWFQDRMEGGPRALGARTILADPRFVESRDKVNEIIKYRENWRPFTPSMTEEGAKMYFDHYTHAPFMIMTFRANRKAENEIPAVVHIDKTSRPQIVNPNRNPRYHTMIEEFKKITGVPVVLNTSYNIKGEPIVCTPQDAIRTFFATGLDVLAIGNCIVEK
jgi:carbamoyltransferase